MKKGFFAIALVAIIIGLGACGSSTETLSDKCEIISFKVSTQTYDINGLNITWTYPKSGPDAWATLPQWPAQPTIEISPNASISPAANVGQNFETGVTYVVTAQDGKTKKTYQVKAQKGTEMP